MGKLEDLEAELRASIAAAKALGPLTPCSWCGHPRRSNRPLCGSCNPHADQIMAVVERANDGR